MNLNHVKRALRGWLPPQSSYLQKFRQHSAPIVVGLIITILSVSVFMVSSNFLSGSAVSVIPVVNNPISEQNFTQASPSPQPTLMPIPVDFTIPVGSAVGGSSNVFTVNVDLNDGMSRDEAITVAETILNRELTNALHELKSAEVNNEGIWNVNFNWEYANMVGPDDTGTPVLSHFFNVIINPQNRTATYTRCM
jgi:hypothetical protein